MPVQDTIDLKKAKMPMMLMPLPQEHSLFISKIVFLWGQFERYFDFMIEAMIEHSGYPAPESWKGQNFKKRRNLYRTLVHRSFQDNFPLTCYLLQIDQDASRPQLARNALCHGSIHIDDKPDLCIVAEIKHNGKLIILRFNHDKLEKTYYEVAHLAGRLNAFNKGSSPNVPNASYADKLNLLAFLQKSYWTLPIQSTS